MLSREEKKKKVIELRKKDKSIRQIAKAVHMSLGEIGQIIKEEFGEEQIRPTLQQGQYTKALQLFETGKSLFDVAVELHLTCDEVLKTYRDYLKLKNLDKLNKIYQDLGDNIQPFLTLHGKINETGKTPQDAMIIANHIDKLDLLQLSCNQKSREVVQLNLNIQALSGTCQGLRNQQGILQYENNVLQGQYHNLSATNQYLLGENFRIQSYIQYLNSLGPAIINDIAGKEIQSILASNREILSLATSAVFLAVTQDPSKMYTINALSMMQFNNPFVQTDLEFYRNEFLDLAQRAYENLTLQCARKIVDSILQRKPIFGLETSLQYQSGSNF